MSNRCPPRHKPTIGRGAQSGEVRLEGVLIGKVRRGTRLNENGRSVRCWDARYRGGLVAQRDRRGDAVDDLVARHRRAEVEELRDAARHLLDLIVRSGLKTAAAEARVLTAINLANLDNEDEVRRELWDAAYDSRLIPDVRTAEVPEPLADLWLSLDDLEVWLRLVVPRLARRVARAQRRIEKLLDDDEQVNPDRARAELPLQAGAIEDLLVTARSALRVAKAVGLSDVSEVQGGLDALDRVEADLFVLCWGFANPEDGDGLEKKLRAARPDRDPAAKATVRRSLGLEGAEDGE